jgi:hypothetical protein
MTVKCSKTKTKSTDSSGADWQSGKAGREKIPLHFQHRRHGYVEIPDFTKGFRCGSFTISWGGFLHGRATENGELSSAAGPLDSSFEVCALCEFKDLQAKSYVRALSIKRRDAVVAMIGSGARFGSVGRYYDRACGGTDDK